MKKAICKKCKMQMGGAIADYRKRGRRREGQGAAQGRLLDVGCGCACLKNKKPSC